MLDANAFYALYGPDDRADLPARAGRRLARQMLPMLRSAYSDLAIDPATEQGIPDPTWFGAAYYAITCTDYAEGADDGEAAAREIIERGKAVRTAGAAPAARLFRRTPGLRLLAQARREEAARRHMSAATSRP